MASKQTTKTKKPIQKKATKTTPKRTKKSVAYCKPRKVSEVEPDGKFLLKLVVVVLLSTLWLKFNTPLQWLGLVFTALPLGVLVGLLLIRAFEHFQTDRKIWYTVLVIVGILSYFVPAGIII